LAKYVNKKFKIVFTPAGKPNEKYSTIKEQARNLRKLT